eukprot:TRINITY_DN920_c0_g2_i4.p1 TRINITY_DN920_c0_g2~~TRINITY_DN920_c0_g2_i4.p1  ORF type:complete len:515 (-),score=109.61 TRINITY_DN920_c0_g2_i4:1760-3304(-)
MEAPGEEKKRFGMKRGPQGGRSTAKKLRIGDPFNLRPQHAAVGRSDVLFKSKLRDSLFAQKKRNAISSSWSNISENGENSLTSIPSIISNPRLGRSKVRDEGNTRVNNWSRGVSHHSPIRISPKVKRALNLTHPVGADEISVDVWNLRDVEGSSGNVENSITVDNPRNANGEGGLMTISRDDMVTENSIILSPNKGNAHNQTVTMRNGSTSFSPEMKSNGKCVIHRSSIISHNGVETAISDVNPQKGNVAHNPLVMTHNEPKSLSRNLVQKLANSNDNIDNTNNNNSINDNDNDNDNGLNLQGKLDRDSGNFSQGNFARNFDLGRGASVDSNHNPIIFDKGSEPAGGFNFSNKGTTGVKGNVYQFPNPFVNKDDTNIMIPEMTLPPIGERRSIAGRGAVKDGFMNNNNFAGRGAVKDGFMVNNNNFAGRGAVKDGFIAINNNFDINLDTAASNNNIDNAGIRGMEVARQRPAAMPPDDTNLDTAANNNIANAGIMGMEVARQRPAAMPPDNISL